MTSSLVGSEMCIRDRFPACTPPDVADGGQGEVIDDLVRGVQEELNGVPLAWHDPTPKRMPRPPVAEVVGNPYGAAEVGHDPGAPAA
eukprot:7441177-Prorocentrum_lima.AAC.1